MKLRLEGSNMLHQIVREPLPGYHRKAGNVVNRVFGIKSGTLTARAVQNIDDLAFEVE